jgi:hypothetical protein
MTVAMLGLVGVVIGALLGGIASAAVERNKQRAAAAGLAAMMSQELQENAERIEDTLRSHTWWKDELRNDAWTGDRRDLFAVLGRRPEEFGSHLRDAYVLVDESNSLWKMKGANPPDADDELKLAPMAAALRNAVVKLHESLREDTRRERRSRIRFGLVATASILLAFAVILAIPFEHRTEATVAAAVESVFPNTAADCDREADDWRCTVYSLAAGNSTCYLGDQNPAVALAAPPAPGEDRSSCELAGPPFVLYVFNGGDHLIVTAATPSAAGTQTPPTSPLPPLASPSVASPTAAVPTQTSSRSTAQDLRVQRALENLHTAGNPRRSLWRRIFG